MPAHAQAPDFSLPALPPIPGSPVAPPPAAPTVSAQPKGAAPTSPFTAKPEQEIQPQAANAPAQAIPELSDVPMGAPTPNTATQVANEAAKAAVATPGPTAGQTPPSAQMLPSVNVTSTVPGFAPPPTVMPPPPIPTMPPSFLKFEPSPSMAAAKAEPKTPVITWNTKLAPAIIPPKTNFNYRRQILPDAIYRISYDRENRHLPRQVTKEYYSQLLLARAARNDVNGTRALLNAGASPQGALSTAQAYGAHDVVALLMARGVAY